MDLHPGGSQTPLGAPTRSVGRLRDGARVVPGMVAAIQTHGELLHWHPHLHVLLTCGAFTPAGDFVGLPELDLNRLEVAWQEAVFALYLAPFYLGRGQDRTGSGREHAQLGVQRFQC